MRLHKLHRRRPDGGNLLMLAMGLVVVLITLVAALHQYEVVSRRGVNGTSADLQLQQVKRWELAKQLNKLPAGVTQPSFQVSGGTVAVSNSTQINGGYAGNVLSMDGSGNWNGLPNLLVTRVDPAPTTPPAIPAAFVEYDAKPTSSDSALDVFHGRTYREVTNGLPPYAAYAPAGNITLSDCVGWANPASNITVPAIGVYSGVPTVLAAQGTVTVANMPYGTIYGNTINVAQGMAVPLPNKFPVSAFEGNLTGNITTQMSTLSTNAQTSNDKTVFISGAPPSVGSIMGLATGQSINFNSWLSLRSSLMFPFPTLPGFAVTDFPDCYVAFQFWFHTPYPPDKTGDGSDPMAKVQADSASLSSLQTQQGELQYMLNGFTGTAATNTSVTNSTSGQVVNGTLVTYGQNSTVANQTPSSTTTGNITVSSPSIPSMTGLVPQSTALLASLNADLITVTAYNTSNPTKTAPVTTGLQTDQSLLSWAADFGPTGYSNANPPLSPGLSESPNAQAPPTIFPLLGVSDPNLFTPANRATAIFNNGLLGKSKDSFPAPAKGSTTVPTPTEAYNGTNVTGSTADITTSQWNTILNPQNYAAYLPGVVLGTTPTIADQIAFLKFMTNTANPDNPFTKAKAIQNDLQGKLNNVNTSINTTQATINADFATLQTAANGTVPSRRSADVAGTKGQAGFAYSPYGYSFDFFFNLIKDIINGNFNNWQPNWPVVFYGDQNNADLPIALDLSFTVPGTFTVPQNRTFYYGNSTTTGMTVMGDLWLQRGSTMVVQGDLTVQAPASPANLGSPTTLADKLNFFLPCGRIVLEEGATLIVSKNLSCQGTLERGSVITTCPSGSIHPITGAILCNGNVVIPYGIYNGLGVGDLLPAIGLASINKDVMEPLLAFLAPNLGKVWGAFHRRHSFFATSCAAYQLEIFIGPFGIPIPILNPYPIPPRNNVWVSLYNYLSFFYAFMDNVNLGENLYPQSDWWPGGATNTTGYCGVVPVVPKLDPMSVVNTLVSTYNSLVAFDFSQLPAMAQSWITGYFNNLWSNLTTNLFTSVISNMLAGMLPAGANAITGPLMSSFDSQATSDDNASNTTSAPMGGLSSPITALENTVENWAIAKGTQTLEDSLAHEVGGLLVYGSTIKIGFDPTSGTPLAYPNQPWMASGMFVAGGDIDINTAHTVGTIISRQGNINNNGANTSLLFYPYYGQDCLYQQNASSLESQISSGLNWSFLVHAGDYQYGPAGMSGPYSSLSPSEPFGTGLDVAIPGLTHLTVDGWDQ